MRAEAEREQRGIEGQGWAQVNIIVSGSDDVVRKALLYGAASFALRAAGDLHAAVLSTPVLPCHPHQRHHQQPGADSLAADMHEP